MVREYLPKHQPREAGEYNIIEKNLGKLNPPLLTSGADVAIMIADGTVP
jgi:hypothetical protein